MDKFINILSHFRQFNSLQIFTIYLRYLIGGGFVIAAIGMGKFNNQELLISSPGVSIEKLEPIQQFFRVMSTSGMYWNFIGWTQLISGILLMTQRFAKLGAAIFFGLILNIFIITLSFNFHGTPIITGLMLLAASYLILWDFDSFQYLLRKPGPLSRPIQELEIADRFYWAIVGGLLLVTVTLGYFAKFDLVYQLGACVTIGLVSLIVFFAFRKKAKEHLSL